MLISAVIYQKMIFVSPLTLTLQRTKRAHNAGWSDDTPPKKYYSRITTPCSSIILQYICIHWMGHLTYALINVITFTWSTAAVARINIKLSPFLHQKNLMSKTAKHFKTCRNYWPYCWGPIYGKVLVELLCVYVLSNTSSFISLCTCLTLNSYCSQEGCPGPSIPHLSLRRGIRCIPCCC